jgi:alkylation response protein AidB-like acyl-CoA dehydrogenase
MHELLDADTLKLLRSALDRYARERYPFARYRQALATPPAFAEETWQDYAQMGWLALPLAGEDGGFDSAPEAVGALMQYVGQSLALEPVFASVVLCGRALALAGADDEAACDALRAIAAGERIFAFAHAEDASDGMQGGFAARAQAGRITGRKLLVLHGDRADALLVSARDERGDPGLFLVDAHQTGVRRSAFRLVDGRGAANIDFEAVPARRIAATLDAQELLARVLDDARLALCAEAYGACKALNALTLAYLKERRQFGRPIGSNQALQHRMVELHMLEEEARAVIQAAWRAGADERHTAIPAAVAHVMQAARLAAHEAVQMHGGIGVTEEFAVSHYFRRILVAQRLLGDRELHLQAFAAGVAQQGQAVA